MSWVKIDTPVTFSPLLQHREQRNAQQRPRHAAHSPGERRAPDHNGGDRIKEVLVAEARGGRSELEQQNGPTEAGSCPGNDKRQGLVSADGHPA